jgi:gamma-glutamyl hercynylcysteine S-oxide synthase
MATPALRSDPKERIARGLEEARARSLALLDPISEHDLTRQFSPIMSPLVWDLAHIGWFEELWLLRRIADAEPVRPENDDLYEAFAHGRAERASLPLLRPADAVAYLGEVRARALVVLDRIELAGDPLLEHGYVYGLVIQHEHQHLETMLQTLQLSGLEYPLGDEAAPAGRELPGDVEVEGGIFTMGTDDEPWAYDNERRAHEVELEPFAIDAAPVTNRAFAEFVEAGGYRDDAAWEPEGRDWRESEGLEHPLAWAPDGEGSWSRVRFGHREPVPPDEPVQHVSWYEADAFARWAGRRLPTEAEWERAIGGKRYPWGDEAEPGRANLATMRFGPAAAGSFPQGAAPCNAEQLVGDVWEWTSSDFTAYPGFRAFPYSEYSEVFFGSEYKVLRGGSWATHPAAVRRTFRNWDFPIRRQLFAGFRTARAA